MRNNFTIKLRQIFTRVELLGKNRFVRRRRNLLKCYIPAMTEDEVEATL